MKIELVQFPYTKAGPTVCLEGWAIAGPNPFGVGKTLWEYEVKERDIDRMERIIQVYRKNRKEKINMGIPKFPGFFESSLIDEDQKPTDKKSDKKLKKKSKRKSTLFEISFDVTIKKPY